MNEDIIESQSQWIQTKKSVIIIILLLIFKKNHPKI